MLLGSGPKRGIAPEVADVLFERIAKLAVDSDRYVRDVFSAYLARLAGTRKTSNDLLRNEMNAPALRFVVSVFR